MTGPYRLFCEYVHCCGKKTLELGEAETESMAKEWIQEQILNRKRPKLPLDDLIRTCPVAHCPAKRQYPRYDYGPMDG